MAVFTIRSNSKAASSHKKVIDIHRNSKKIKKYLYASLLLNIILLISIWYITKWK